MVRPQSSGRVDHDDNGCFGILSEVLVGVKFNDSVSVVTVNNVDLFVIPWLCFSFGYMG